MRYRKSMVLILLVIFTALGSHFASAEKSGKERYKLINGIVVPTPDGPIQASRIKYPKRIGHLNAFHYPKLTPRISGETVLQILIDTQGKVVDAKVLVSLRKDYDDAALRFVRTLQYSPGLLDEEAKPFLIEEDIYYRS